MIAEHTFEIAEYVRVDEEEEEHGRTEQNG